GLAPPRFQKGLLRSPRPTGRRPARPGLGSIGRPDPTAAYRWMVFEGMALLVDHPGNGSHHDKTLRARREASGSPPPGRRSARSPEVNLTGTWRSGELVLSL